MVQRRQERDLQFIAPLIATLTEIQFEIFMLFASATVRHAPDGLSTLVDDDVADAASTAAATLETAGRGIIYEHRASSMPAQRLAAEFKLIIADLQHHAGSAVRTAETDMVAALRCLERAARTAAASLEGDQPPVYLGLARRLIEQLGLNAQANPATGPAPAGESPRLILP